MRPPRFPKRNLVSLRQMLPPRAARCVLSVASALACRDLSPHPQYTDTGKGMMITPSSIRKASLPCKQTHWPVTSAGDANLSRQASLLHTGLSPLITVTAITASWQICYMPDHRSRSSRQSTLYTPDSGWVPIVLFHWTCDLPFLHFARIQDSSLPSMHNMNVRQKMRDGLGTNKYPIHECLVKD